MKPFIRAQLDKKDRKLDDWQAVVERAMDIMAKAAEQTPLLV